MKSKARQELYKDRDEILKLFSCKCVVCGRPSVVIHEVIPLSHGKIAMGKDNRVVICGQHHAWAHAVGTNISIPILQQKREEYLTRYQLTEMEFRKENEGNWDE